MRGIPVDSLPKTYEDAAQTTWRLGYEYLWIDSLCILQDCSLDWERESAIMGDIYRGSVMTIATLSAGSKSDGGFFTIRNPLKYVPCSLLTREDNYHIFKKPRMSSNHFAIGPNFAEEERHPVGELLSRGWVVQERVLSPRTLYFEPRSIIWECNYCYTIPEFPEMTFLGSMQISYSPKQAFSLLSLESLPDLKNPTEKFLTFHASWSRLLGSYTKCHLTMASDKLVAVNGMIRKIEASSGMHAIAGLFLEILPLELLWFSVQNAEVALPPGPYRAPSWSWASLDVLVKSNYVELVRKYKFSFDWKLQVVSHVADAKPNGQLASAHIVVEGALREINWPSHHQRTRRLRPFPIQESNKKFEHRDHWVADCTDVYSGNIWALHVAHGTGAFFIARDPECSVFEDGMCDVGILLKKLDGEDGIFRRVGYFEQRYWALDTHPIFAPALAINTRRIKLV
jgi:hypothetical protein